MLFFDTKQGTWASLTGNLLLWGWGKATPINFAHFFFLPKRIENFRRNPSSGVEGLGISSRADVDWRAELTLLHARRTAIRDSHALASGII